MSLREVGERNKVKARLRRGKKLYQDLSPRARMLGFFGFFFAKEFFHTVLTAKIIIPSRYPFPHGSSRWDIGLATGVLNKFFGFSESAQLSSLYEYLFKKPVKARGEEEKKKNE